MLELIDWKNVDSQGFVIGHTTRGGMPIVLQHISKNARVGETYHLGVWHDGYVHTYVYTKAGFWKRWIVYEGKDFTAANWDSITPEMIVEFNDPDSIYDVLVDVDFY